jgi:DNA-3-methyladenine glycosylase
MNITKLPQDFYLQKCSKVACELVGKVLVRIKNGIIYSGIIVETEAYLGKNDPASHSYNGMTKRNEVMFHIGGTAYVYFTYGNHYCLNVVTGQEGTANAVLLRAIEPVLGIDRMMKNRGTNNVYNIASGPGKLTKAMEIDKKLNGASLLGDEIFIMNNESKHGRIFMSPRIGITRNAEKKLRFFAGNNPFVTKSKFNYI